MKKNKRQTPMEKLTQGYEKFVEGKDLKKNGKEQFNKAIMKAAKPKLRGSK